MGRTGRVTACWLWSCRPAGFEIGYVVHWHAAAGARNWRGRWVRDDGVWVRALPAITEQRVGDGEWR